MPGRREGPALTVDAVWLAGDRILLVRRRYSPFRGRWAFPGGFVEKDETVEAAITREVYEETGLRPKGVRLLGVYSWPGRDPRGPTVTVAFRASGPANRPRGSSDAAEARWVPIRQARQLAFDHDEILSDALHRRRTTVSPRRPRGPAARRRSYFSRA